MVMWKSDPCILYKQNKKPYFVNLQTKYKNLF